MTDQQRKALATLRLNSAETPDDVWQTPPSHVDGLHAKAEDRIRAGIADARNSTGPSPIGLVLQGRRGVGKTHLLGSVRRMVQREGGYFFLIELTTGAEFWNDVAEAMRSELRRSTDDGELQLTVLLRQLCELAAVPPTVVGPITGSAPLTPHDLDVLLNHLREVDGRIAFECGDTIRALVLYASEHADIGMSHLLGLAEGSREWGLLPRAKQPQVLVRDISRVLAMTGPCVIAIDQLDTLVNIDQDETDARVATAELKKELPLIADGLMKLREKTRRTLSIVACLPNTWKKLHDYASDTVRDRFAETPILGAITDPEVGRALVERWLGERYRRNDVTPPHPTWPVAASAFGNWVSRTPRQLLRRIEAHAEACLYGEIRELTSFDEEITKSAPPEPDGGEPDYLQEFDARFQRLREKAEVTAAELKLHNEDDVMPGLLLAGLKSWINEVGNDDMAWQASSSRAGATCTPGCCAP